MKVLALFPRDLYDRKMSIGRVLYIEALGRQPGVELRWSGIGWPGFDPSRTVRENCGDSDVIWAYKAEGLRGFEEFPVRLVTFNEANHPKTLDEIAAAKANLVVFHHMNDMGRWNLDCATVHIPHCADPAPATPVADRPVDCLFAGVVSPEVYPLRSRLAGMLRSGSLPGRVRQHPGYRLRSHADCRIQHAAYMEDLARAKILLTCTSAWHYPLAKIAEAASRGCVVASDMPNDAEFQRTLGKFIIELDPADPDEVIAATIRRWLSKPEELQELADQARLAVQESFSTNHYAQRILAAISLVSTSDHRMIGA